ncbi:MAG: hypothetical protein ACTS3F_13745 [Phycisphaerales bacterium]
MLRSEPTHRERLAWRALNRMGVRTCERCGYDTRGVETDRCPECGALQTGDASLNAHARRTPETKASAEG